jgi:hypothetical protein
VANGVDGSDRAGDIQRLVGAGVHFLHAETRPSRRSPGTRWIERDDLAMQSKQAIDERVGHRQTRAREAVRARHDENRLTPPESINRQAVVNGPHHRV